MAGSVFRQLTRRKWTKRMRTENAGVQYVRGNQSPMAACARAIASRQWPPQTTSARSSACFLLLSCVYLVSFFYFRFVSLAAKHHHTWNQSEALAKYVAAYFERCWLYSSRVFGSDMTVFVFKHKVLGNTTKVRVIVPILFCDSLWIKEECTLWLLLPDKYLYTHKLKTASFVHGPCVA